MVCGFRKQLEQDNIYIPGIAEAVYNIDEKNES